MASSVQLSEIATSYPTHENYTNEVSAKINEFIHANSKEGASFFIQSICHDPHFRGVLAQHPDVLNFFTKEEVSMLSQELSSLTTVCMECLSISFASSSLATSEITKEEAIPTFGTLYLRQEEYVQAVLCYINTLQPFLEADMERFFALVKQIQNDVYFRNVVAEYPLLLQFMPPTEDVSLIILALSKYVGFMQANPHLLPPKDDSETYSMTSQSSDELCDMESDDACDDSAHMRVDDQTATAAVNARDEEEMFTTITDLLGDFYRIVAVKQVAHPDVIAAMLATHSECKGVGRWQFYQIVHDLLYQEDGDEKWREDIVITKLLVNFFPPLFLALPFDIKNDIEWACAVLPNQPFLFFFLSQELQENPRIKEIAIGQGRQVVLQNDPTLFSKAPQPSMQTLQDIHRQFEEFGCGFRGHQILEAFRIKAEVYRNGRTETYGLLYSVADAIYRDITMFIQALETQEGADQMSLVKMSEDIQKIYEHFLLCLKQHEEKFGNDQAAS